MPTPEIEALLARYPTRLELSVLWGHMDALRHVNNTIYFRFLESGRIAYFEQAQLVDWSEEGMVGPILASTTCNYKIPLTYPDTVHTGARVRKMGRSSLVMEHLVVSARLNAVAAAGEATLVMFDYAKQRSVPIPEKMRQSVRAFQNGDVEE